MPAFCIDALRRGCKECYRPASVLQAGWKASLHDYGDGAQSAGKWRARPCASGKMSVLACGYGSDSRQHLFAACGPGHLCGVGSSSGHYGTSWMPTSHLRVSFPPEARSPFLVLLSL